MAYVGFCGQKKGFPVQHCMVCETVQRCFVNWSSNVSNILNRSIHILYITNNDLRFSHQVFHIFFKKTITSITLQPPAGVLPNDLIRISETVLTSRAERICSLPAFSALVYQGLEPNGDESDTSAATPSDLADELFTGFEDGVA